MITLERDRLEFRFPEVHADARCSIEFQRTLRVPDEGTEFPLPPGLGRFPLRHLDDYVERLPQAWRRRGGVIAPMHQADALWINFRSDYPFAVKIGTGKICAITGGAWTDHLNRDPQDYAILPEQPWLDGYCVDEGVIRQFVAMPLGEGYTVEEQLTGIGEHGGLQIVAYPMKRDRYEALIAMEPDQGFLSEPVFLRRQAPDMGLSPGGCVKQEIFVDPHEFDAWDQRRGSRCFVSIVNSAQWMAITGETPPTRPPSANDYSDAGLPWFDYYGGDAEVLSGADRFKGVASVKKLAKERGETALPEEEQPPIIRVVALGPDGARLVRELWEDIQAVGPTAP